jgi:hypothetical protein
VETLQAILSIEGTRHNGYGGDKKGPARPEYRSCRIGYIMRGTRGKAGYINPMPEVSPEQKQIVFEE